MSRLSDWTPLIIYMAVIFMNMGTKVSSALTGCKSCYYDDAPGGEKIEYEIRLSSLKNGTCPPKSEKKIESCQVEKYKEPGSYFRYKKCTRHGGACTKHEDCCQSYARSKAAANLPIIMFPHCQNKKCIACLKNKWPCGSGSKIPCCEGLVKNSGIHCRPKDELTFSPYFPFIWGICGPARCDKELMKEMELYNTPCFSYNQEVVVDGTLRKEKPEFSQYEAVNFCKCGTDKGYQCNQKKECVPCGIEGQGEDSKCKTNADCCKHHVCKDVMGADWKKECFQGDCTLEGQRDFCDGTYNTTDGMMAERKCCDGLRCLTVTDDSGDRLYSICTREPCGEEYAPCTVDYHCCVKKGLKCMKIEKPRGKFCLNPTDKEPELQKSK